MSNQSTSHRAAMYRWPGGPLAAAVIVMAGCSGTTGSYLSQTADAWGALAVEAATPGVQLGLGLAALAAELCPLSVDEWRMRVAAGVTPSEDVTARLGLDAGVVQKDNTTGAYSVVFEDVPILMGAGDDEQFLTLTVTAVTPTELLKVRLSRPEAGDQGAGDEQDLLITNFTTSACDSEAPSVTATIAPVFQDWSLDLPDATADDLVFATGSAVPETGAVGWSGTLDIGRAVLNTEDAAEIHDGLWPATTGGLDWSTTVEVPLQ